MKRADFLSLPRVVVMTALAMGAPVTTGANSQYGVTGADALIVG
jgi:hypothetical protein